MVELLKPISVSCVRSSLEAPVKFGVSFLTLSYTIFDFNEPECGRIYN